MSSHGVDSADSSCSVRGKPNDGIQYTGDNTLRTKRTSAEDSTMRSAYSTPADESLARVSLGDNTCLDAIRDDTRAQYSGVTRSNTCPEGLSSLVQLPISRHPSEETCQLSHLLGKQRDPDAVPDDVTSEITPRRGIGEKFRSWRSRLEPRSAWITMCLSIIPINFLIGVDFLSFPIYYVEYTAHFPDSSKSVIGLIVATKMTMVSVFGIVTSSLIPRFGCRRICMVGGLIMFIGLFLSCFATNILLLCVTQGLVQGIGYSMAIMTTNIVVQRNFRMNGALGEGIAMMGISIGNISGPPLINWLVQKYSWRGSLLIHTAIIAHIVPLGALLKVAKSRDEFSDESRDIPVTGEVTRVPCDQPCDISVIDLSLTESVQRKMTIGGKLKQLLKDIFDFRLFRYFPFLLISISGACDRFCITTFMQHVPSRAVYLGLSLTDGATFLSTCATSIVVFRAFVTVVANLKCMSRVSWYGLGGLAGGLDAFIMVIFKSYEGQLAGSILNGIHIGITNTITNVMLVDLMGLAQLPRAIALFNITVSVASMSAAPIAGLLYDVTGSYDPPFLLAGSIGIVSGVCGITASILNSRTIKQKELQLAN